MSPRTATPSAPPILLLHGITSFGGTWDWIVPDLVERFRVLRLDFRGHGASDRAPGEYFPEGYVSDAVAAIEQAAGRPCVVMGHSLGGATAAALTQQHPDLVVAAVMEDPPLGLAGDPDGTTWCGEAALSRATRLLESFRVIRESAPRATGLRHHRRGAGRNPRARRRPPRGARSASCCTPTRSPRWRDRCSRSTPSVLDPVLTGSIRTFLDPDAPFGSPSLIVCADPTKPDAVADPALAEHFVVDLAGDRVRRARRRRTPDPRRSSRRETASGTRRSRSSTGRSDRRSP